MRVTYEQLERRDLPAAIPALHSYPGAEHTLFLDFDGHRATGTTWNLQYGTIHAPPFDIDGALYQDGLPAFSHEEVARMVSIWERMAEDFRPFNVDVTTEDPSLLDPNIFHVGGRALRVVFTSKFDAGSGGTGERWFQDQTQGFTAESWHFGRDTPAWVFSTHHLAGEIGSHEVGHALGLQHDGFFTADQVVEYRGEHGGGATRWSPIMGQGNVLSQWSKGEYPSATNREDDIGLLVAALGRRPDDYPDVTALPVGNDGVVELEGVIETRGDKDVFSFSITRPETRVALRALPWHNGPNLDIAVSLYGLRGGLIVPFHDPVANPVDGLASLVDMKLAPDTYFLTIDGVGKPATDSDPGFSDYGSLGYYRIVGTIGAVLPGDINADGVVSSRDLDALYAAIAATRETGVVEMDFNGDGQSDQADVDFMVRDLLGGEYGDLDLNGQVDFGDFLTLVANFGRRDASWSDGDVDGDGEVGLVDFLLLSTHFNDRGLA